MKKLILLTAVLTLSACACMEDYEEEPVTYKTVEPKNLNCDYFDGKTCYRYVRRTRQVVAPVVQYREPVARPCQMATQCAAAPVVAPAPTPCGGCAPKVSQTREPVEITYKKTTYTTTYQPQTTSSVEYEKVPYTTQQVVMQPQVQVVQPVAQPTVKTVVQPTVQTVTTTPTVAVTLSEPTELVEYDTNDEVLLNVK